jgi:hypothetical protein
VRGIRPSNQRDSSTIRPKFPDLYADQLPPAIASIMCYGIYMRQTILLLIASLGFAASCAHDPHDRPLTAAEKERMIEAATAQEAVSDTGTTSNSITPRSGCANSTSLSRFGARGTNFSGADGFDTRGCNAVGQ